MRGILRVAVIGVGVCLAAGSAYAGYDMTLSGPASVMPGDTFDLQANMTRDADEAIDTFDFWLMFDYGLGETDTAAGGVQYNGYSFGLDSQGATIFEAGVAAEDASTPFLANLPQMINRDLVTINMQNAPDVWAIDLRLQGISRVVGGDTQLWDEGTLVSLNLEIPGTYLDEFPQGTLDIRILPVAFTAPDRAVVDVRIGDPLSIKVVPEPATLALLGLGGVFALRRRRTA